MKLALRISITWLLLTLLFTGVMTGTFCIPKSAIDYNLMKSVLQVTEDGKMFTAHVGSVEPLKIGIFSDCLILGIIYCADDTSPLKSAMEARFMMKDGSPITAAELMLERPQSSDLQPVIYSRYWHGNQAIIRPLLCVTTVYGIRVINIVVLSALLLLLAAAMWRKVNGKDALIVTLALAAVMVPSVPLCLNYVPTFYIALIASLLILLWRPATANLDNSILLFFVIGAATSFFDLLTTPLVAMAVPLTVYMLYRRPAKACRVVMLGLAWLAGYALLWATKWMLAVLFTGHDAIHDAMGAVTQRTVGHDEGDYMLWCLKWTLAAFAVTAGLTTLVSVVTGKARQALRRNGWMLLVAMSSFVWALVLLEHTWHHLHFTWRTFVVAAIGILLFICHLRDVDDKKLLET